MKVLLIFSMQDGQSADRPLQTAENIQFGISYISATLKTNGHETRLLVLSRDTDREKIDACVDDFSPELICFSAVYTEYQFIADVAKHIKKRYPDVFLLAGGAHISLCPQDCLSDPFDALCIGEGEYPTLELAEQLQNRQRPSGILNLWIKNGVEVERNLPRPFNEDLDKLPFPDREIWREWIVDQAHSTVLVGRGCPFLCTYCSNHALRKLASGSYVRYRSADNILAEIRELISDHPDIKEIHLETETLIVNKDFAIELCAKLEDLNRELGTPITFGSNIRVTPNADVESVFAAFKKAGFRYVGIGLESGSERVRKEILKRNYSNKDIVNVVDMARKYDLKVRFFNLVGIPGETLSDFQDTIAINRRCLPDWHFLSIFYPYPGTDLYRTAKSLGLLDKPLDSSMERSKAVLDLPGFSRQQIQKAFIWFDYNVYRGHKPLYKILVRVLMAKIKSSDALTRLFRKATKNSLARRLKGFFIRGY